MILINTHEFFIDCLGDIVGAGISYKLLGSLYELMSIDDGAVVKELSKSSFLVDAPVKNCKYWIFEVDDKRIIGVEFVGWRSRELRIVLPQRYSGIEKDILSIIGFMNGRYATRVIIECHDVEGCKIDVDFPCKFTQTIDAVNYTVDLATNDYSKNISKNHARNIEKAKKVINKIDLPDDEAIMAHVEMIGFSNSRQEAKGYNVIRGDNVYATRRYLKNKSGGLYQAGIGSQVMSSMLISVVGKNAYFIMGGTSPEGMKLGASHFLYNLIMEDLKYKGVEYFVLGIANAEGLAKYKMGFGATPFPIKRMFFDGNGQYVMRHVLGCALFKIERLLGMAEMPWMHPGKRC